MNALNQMAIGVVHKIVNSDQVAHYAIACSF